MPVKVEKVHGPVELGEAPHWSVQTNTLYYVDINGRQILRFNPSTQTVTSAYLKDGYVGVAVPVDGTSDKLVAACGTDIVLVTWDGQSDTTNPPVKKLVSLDTDRTNTRINDGKCDFTGRFWLGTMALEVNASIEPNRGSVYTVDEDLNLKKVISPVSISNGLTWNKDNNIFYYIDSLSYQVWAYDYNLSDGDISNKRVIFDFRINDVKGLPDGMTIDSDGNLWIALFLGGAVVQIDPNTGKLLRKVEMPVDRITSVAFGGPEFDILYVTTAYVNMTAEEIKEKPESGSLYAIKGLGVRGCPPVDFKYTA